jgi:hypothetical protein
MEDPTNSAQEAGQKPLTKVFILQVGQTCSYNIYVEAESEEQAKQVWEKIGFQYSANLQPDYEWENDQFIFDVSVDDCTADYADVDYDEVRRALGLESLKVKEK